jgi:CubicO group peptidase (beta-lactamase class C family)
LDLKPLFLLFVVAKSSVLRNLVLTIILPLLCWGCQSGKGKEVLKNDPAFKAIAPKPSLSEEEKRKYHDLVANFVERNLLRGSFNGAILVAKDGVPVYERYVGFRDLRTKDSITAETCFQIASTSKPFTAAAVLQLVQQGKISLNDSVSSFFPGFPYPGVTVKNLLNHRSGLPNYLYYMEKGNWDRKLLATNNDVVNTLTNWKPGLAYRTNSHFNYCNTNYVLLASIVEKVTGLSFPQYMQQNIFEPLGMTNTYIHTIQDSARTTPSFDGYGGLWQLDFSDGPYGDKNVYSTPRDLLKWDQAWYTNALLDQALIDSAFTPYSNERPSQHNYGLGWRMLQIPNGKKVIYHNGRWHGFNSAFARLTDEKVTIIIITNRFNRNVYPVARKMYNLFGNYDGKEDAGEE